MTPAGFIVEAISLFAIIFMFASLLVEVEGPK